VSLNKTRIARSKQHQDGHADAFSRTTAYDGWKHNLYPYAWFDSTPEYRVAQAVDDADSVTVWARLQRGDIPITWTVEGRQYNPDLVVVEGTGPDRVCWLVETKADKDVTSQDVVGKRRAAKTWASTVNNSEEVDGTWRYLLLREVDVNDAGGSWPQMKEFGQ
jgi:type III restriction enzyme